MKLSFQALLPLSLALVSTSVAALPRRAADANWNAFFASAWKDVTHVDAFATASDGAAQAVALLNQELANVTETSTEEISIGKAQAQDMVSRFVSG